MKVTVRVTIGELVLRNSELDVLEIVQELGRHTTCRIEFTRDRALDVNLDDLLRDPVSVTIKGEGGDPIEIFQGAIVDGVQSHLLNFGSRFALDALSPSERHEFRDTVYYPQSTLSSIAGKLGIKIVGTLRRTPDPFDYVQWGETEFDFLRRLVDEHGGFLVTTGPQVEIRTEFVDKGWDLLWGDSLLEVSARAQPANHGVTGASYETKSKHTHAHAGIRQSSPTLGGAAKLVGTVNELARQASSGGDPGLEIQPARATTHADFKAMLRQESERAIGAAVVVECESTKVGLMVGDLVDLIQGIEFKLPTSGKLGLIKVVHSFKEQLYSNRFVATPWKTFTNLEQPGRPTVDGPVTAEVVDNGPDPDKMGRIKVRYRWLGSDHQTNWARLVSPHAGNDRGWVFVPEVGDEVLVVFEHGDPEQPLVIGSLWNGRDQMPDNADKNANKAIRTRSGNTIRFIDGDQGETIEVATPKGECLIRLVHESGKSILTLYSEGDLELEAKGELRLKSQTFLQQVDSDSARKVGGDDSVDAGKNATIKAGMDLGLSGLNAVLKGGMNVESVAGAVNNVVGTLVHIQPPGFMGKNVAAKSVSIKAVDPGKHETPAAAAPQRTADPKTPRSG